MTDFTTEVRTVSSGMQVCGSMRHADFFAFSSIVTTADPKHAYDQCVSSKLIEVRES